MTIPAGAVVPLDEKRRRRHHLLARLREVDHWRRLVSARLDLAVAAVTLIDEPDDARPGGDPLGPLPAGLREMIGLPDCGRALPEASVLLRLRAAQRDLDEYARALRETTDVATMELADLLVAERAASGGSASGGPGPGGSASGRSGRRPRPVRPAAPPHLRVVPQVSAEDLPPASAVPDSPSTSTDPADPGS